MKGKGYNPKAYEPDTHERFFAPPNEVMERYKEIFTADDPHHKRTNYKEIQEWRKRGESHALGHYAYEQMYDIYSGIEDELLEGAIDSHIHIYPDYVPRTCDIIELGINASKAGMRAVVCKDHFFSSVGQAWGAERVLEEMKRKEELEHTCKILGTHILAWSHHPDQVHLISKYPNLGAIYFCTMTGGLQSGPELKIIDDNGEVTSEVKECITLAAEYKICIMTGHRSPDEAMAIVRACHETGGRVLVTHASACSFGPGMAGGVEHAKEMAGLGAYLELGANKWMPSIIWPIVDPNIVCEYIREVGAENIIANTDYGQVLVCDPIEGFRLFIRGMLHWGITKDEIKTMIQTNPAKVLYLDD